jgi:catechol 2,3-dioxygenase-like lactoylglutathione lyase family enzyme
VPVGSPEIRAGDGVARPLVNAPVNGRPSGTRLITDPEAVIFPCSQRGTAMTITLNHTIVPARDKIAGARFFARIFGLKCGRADHFAPVKVNKSLTLLFDDDDKFESHHLAFHVSNREFDAILRRIKREKIAYGSAPWSLEDGKLNNWNGGRSVYFSDPNGHVLELMTVPQ